MLVTFFNFYIRLELYMFDLNTNNNIDTKDCQRSVGPQHRGQVETTLDNLMPSYSPESALVCAGKAAAGPWTG